MSTNWLDDRLVWPDDVETAPGAALRLAASRCAECDRCSFPATGTCTWCGAAASRSVELADGAAVAATQVLHATPGAVVAAPYVVALVRFPSAGLDVLGRVISADEPASLPAGQPVRVVADQLPDGRLHYAFTTLT